PRRGGLRLRRDRGPLSSGGGDAPGRARRPRGGLLRSRGGALSKTFVCTCEDVSLDDLRQAIAKGHRDIESLKRFTGFGTGTCQGKLCSALVAQVLSEEAELPPEVLQPFTPRPPARMLSLGELAAYPVDESKTPGAGTPAPAEPYEEVEADGGPLPHSHPL